MRGGFRSSGIVRETSLTPEMQRQNTIDALAQIAWVRRKKAQDAQALAFGSVSITSSELEKGCSAE